jgi:hypothetical protein
MPSKEIVQVCLPNGQVVCCFVNLEERVEALIGQLLLEEGDAIAAALLGPNQGHAVRRSELWALQRTRLDADVPSFDGAVQDDGS